MNGWDNNMDKQYIDKDRVCRVVENVMDYLFGSFCGS